MSLLTGEEVLYNPTIEDRRQWTLYTTEEFIKGEITEYRDDWKDSYHGCCRIGKLIMAKEVMFNLTGDSKWTNNLDVLQRIVMDEEVAENKLLSSGK